MRIFEITGNDAGQRLDKFITKAMPLFPKSMMYKAIRTKKIKVNRKRAEIGQMLNEGDTVQVFVKEEFFATSDNRFYQNIKPSFATVYEDENIIVVNKPVGLLCHSDQNEEKDTLIEQIKGYLWKKGEYDDKLENSFAPSLCNRIDRNTAGLVIAAKNASSLRAMNEIIKERTVKKYYLCLLQNMPKKTEDTIEGYIVKDSSNNMVKVYKEKPRFGDAKKAVTKYRIVGRTEDGILCEVELVTGRTHQIRAQMAYIGCPLVGEGKYAVQTGERAPGMKNQALCAYKLVFDDILPSPLEYLEGKTIQIGEKDIPFAGSIMLKKK